MMFGAPGYSGLRLSDLDLTQTPSMLMYFLDAEETKVTFLMSQAFALESPDAENCGADERCPNCRRPFVDIDPKKSFKCITTNNQDGDVASPPQPALVEGYRQVDRKNCYQYHQASTFASQAVLTV